MGVFTKKLNRITGEIRYRPTLGSTRGAVDYGKILEDKFPHWRVQNGRDVSLYDDQKKNLIQIRYNGIMFLNQGDEANNEELIKMLDVVYKEIVETANILEILHVGCRSRYVFEAKFSTQDLIDLSFKKFYGNLEKLKSISGEKVKDTLFVLDAVKGDIQTHVQIGASEAPQAEGFFGETQFPEEFLDKEKTYLLTDVDVFQKNKITKENSSEILKTLEKKNKQTLENYLDFLLEK